MDVPYTESAALYDRIYARKDYQREATAVRALVDARHPRARTLLDVGCGTAGHLLWLARWFEAEGADASPGMLAVARQKLPHTPLQHADMRTLALGRAFDVVTCLFSSIGYVATVDELHAALAALARHVAPGGLLVVEPWFAPEAWRPGTLHATLIDDPDLKIARMCVSATRGRLAVTPMHHMVARAAGVTTFLETHELLLATADEYRAGLVAAGLVADFDPEVLPRGAWIGRRA